MSIFTRNFFCRFWGPRLTIGAAILLIVLGLGAAFSNTSPQSFIVLYSGNRHSELEPCGCSKKQLGGIDKEARYIQDTEKLNVPVLKVDSGGFIDPFLSSNERLKSKFILKIMEQIQYHALNVSEQDLKIGTDLLVSLKDQNKLPLVSANIVDKNSGAPIFEPYRLVKIPMGEGQESLTVGIVGVTYSVASTYRRVAPTAQKPERATIKKEVEPEIEGRFEADPGRWLQFQYGPETGSFQPVQPQRGPVNLVRPSMRGQPARTPADQPQRIVPTKETAFQPPAQRPRTSAAIQDTRRPARVAREARPEAIQAPRPSSATSGQPASYNILDPASTLNQLMPELRDKCDIVMVLSHLGLNGSKQLAREVNEIDIVISGAPSAVRYHPLREGDTLIVHPGFGGRYLGKLLVEMDQNRRIIKAKGENIEIADPMQPDSAITKLIDEYKKETRKLRPPARSPSVKVTYAGVAQCSACHEPQHTSWAATRHAQAMGTLIAKKQQFNPDCLQCHTTGYKDNNGFRDLRTSPAMANVQCEVCHGPAYRHSLEQRIFNQQKKRAAAGTATTATFTARHTPKAAVSPAVCLKCHNEEHDDDFNFERDLKLVSH